MARAMELVVNPAAGAGRAAKLIEPARRALEREGWKVTVHRCGSRTGLRETVKLLAREGAEVVGVMGGDGTFHDAVDALREGSAVMNAPKTALAQLPAGTGGDLAARTFGLPNDIDEVARWLARAEPEPFDVGLLERDGGEVSLFANIASCGVSGRVDELVSRGPKWLGGKAAYLAASARAIAGWRGQAVTVSVDGTKVFEGKVHFVAVCNGRAFGGGMIVAPDARCDDGLFDVVVAEDIGLGGVATTFPKLYKGTHLGEKGVTFARGRAARVETRERDVLLDVDGEASGAAPATFTALPGALRVLRAR